MGRLALRCVHAAASILPSRAARGLLLAACCVPALAAFGCTETRSAAPPRDLDPRAAHLRHWVGLRRTSDGSLFFLDRFEAREQDLVVLDAQDVEVDEPDLPLVSVDLPAALRLARAYWGRLPSFEEWRTAVAGASGYRFPWGEDDGNRLRANTPRLGLWRRTRVGTFESGRDLGRADSCYDLFGNVAEWTLTPYAVVRIDRLDPSDPNDRLELLHDVLPSVPVYGWQAPWGTATPFVPELCGAIGASDPVRDVGFCVVGFSYGQRQPAPHLGSSYWDRYGIRALQAGESASDVGVRIATDPYTFLSLLESAAGQPLDADRAALAEFLRGHLDEFRRAARLRRELDRGLLGLPAPGAWARVAWQVLSVR